MDNRHEVVHGLSGDEARECLAQLVEEDLRHHQALHEFPVGPVGPYSPDVPFIRILANLPGDEIFRQEWERILQAGKVHSLAELGRNIALRYRDDKVHERLLQWLDSLDKHWRKEHPDEPEPGDEYLRSVMTNVRQHPR